MRRLVVLLVIVVCAGACGKGGGSGSTGSAAPVVGSAAGGAVATGSATAGSAAGSGSAAPQLSPKIAAARCDDPCLFLTDTPIAELATAYKAACGKDTTELGFTDCTALDVARNCIYAAHGKVYKKKKWKRRFGSKPWYTPDPSFKESAFTAIETANVKELYHRGKACKLGLHISAADDKRLAAWFDAFAAHAKKRSKPAPPMPKLVMDSAGKELKAAEFLAELDKSRAAYLDLDGSTATKRNGELEYETASKEYIAVDASVADTDVVAQLVAKLPGDQAKLRVIQVDFDLRDNVTEEATVNEGIYVFFIYDAKDALVGLASSSYMLD